MFKKYLKKKKRFPETWIQWWREYYSPRLEPKLLHGFGGWWWPWNITCSALNWHTDIHTPSIAFWHLPPNSARFIYATEGALFISAQLSTDAVSALRKVPVLINYDCRSNLAPKHARKHETHPPRGKKEEEEKKEFRLDSNDCGFVCAAVNFAGGYKWHALFYLSCL